MCRFDSHYFLKKAMSSHRYDSHQENGPKSNNWLLCAISVAFLSASLLGRQFDFNLVVNPVHCDRRLRGLCDGCLRILVVPLLAYGSADVLVAVDQLPAVRQPARTLRRHRMFHLPRPSPDDLGALRARRHRNAQRPELRLRKSVTARHAAMEKHVAHRNSLTHLKCKKCDLNVESGFGIGTPNIGDRVPSLLEAQFGQVDHPRKHHLPYWRKRRLLVS